MDASHQRRHSLGLSPPVASPSHRALLPVVAARRPLSGSALPPALLPAVAARRHSVDPPSRQPSSPPWQGGDPEKAPIYGPLPIGAPPRRCPPRRIR